VFVRDGSRLVADCNLDLRWLDPPGPNWRPVTFDPSRLACQRRTVVFARGLDVRLVAASRPTCFEGLDHPPPRPLGGCLLGPGAVQLRRRPYRCRCTRRRRGLWVIFADGGSGSDARSWKAFSPEPGRFLGCARTARRCRSPRTSAP